MLWSRSVGIKVDLGVRRFILGIRHLPPCHSLKHAGYGLNCVPPKAMVFPVVMYECESWTVKKAECQRIDDFKLWWWRRLLRVPWTSGRSNQSIIMETGPEYSLVGLMLKLKLKYFGHLMQRTGSLEKTLILGRIKGKRRKGQQKMTGWMPSLTGRT